MTSAADATRRIASQLRQQGIEIGLDAIAQEVEAAESPVAGIRRARKRIKDRLRLIDASLRDLTGTLTHLASILPFTEDGWVARRAEIERAIAGDPLTGLAAWLTYWYEAAGDLRSESLRWLRDVPLPLGSTLVSERASTAERGLERRNARACAAFLVLGSHGVEIGGQQLPDAGSRVDLRLLHARLCLESGFTSDAARILDMGEDWRDEAGQLALSARLARLNEDEAQSQSLFDQAIASDPRDLDVTAETILRNRPLMAAEGADGGVDYDTGLDAARAAVDALPSLADVDGDLTPLLDIPSELWIAVAERAGRELDSVTTASALSRAADSALSNSLRALVEEKRAELATSAESRQEALIRAGDLRLAENQVDRALGCYDEARIVVGTEDEQAHLSAAATIRWADCINTLAWPKPYRAKAAELNSALSELVKALPHVDINGAESWAYLVEMGLRQQLARSITEPRETHLWDAALAASRAVALDPTSAHYWVALSDIANRMELRNLSLAAARSSTSIAADTEPALIAALTNAGQLEQALEHVTTFSSSDQEEAAWGRCGLGQVTLLLGRADEAVSIFDEIDIPSRWTWVWPSHVSALMRCGQVARAIDLSHRYFGAMEESPDEVTWLFGAAFDAMASGDVSEATAYARKLGASAFVGESRPLTALGMALLLGGESQGLKFVGESIQLHPAEALEWEQIWRPFLHNIAKEHSLTIPDTTELEHILNRARQLLSAPDWPLADNVPDDVSRTRNVRMALALCNVLIKLANENEPHAEELEHIEAFPELATEATRIRARFAQISLDRRLKVLAGKAIQLITKDESAEAAAALRELLAEDTSDVADKLKDAAGGTVPGSVLAVLREISTGSDNVAIAAENLLQLFAPDQPVGQTPMESHQAFRLRLPPSWFTGFEDPVSQHDLFVRYLPELRVRVDWEVPAVLVGTDIDLEPDGYRIFLGEGILAAGSVDPDLRYCLEDGLDLLPERTRLHPGVRPFGHHWAIPPEALKGVGSLVDLCTMPAVEVVARIVGDVARSLDPARRVDG
jgi:hypothetical protein